MSYRELCIVTLLYQLTPSPYDNHAKHGHFIDHGSLTSPDLQAMFTAWHAAIYVRNQTMS